MSENRFFLMRTGNWNNLATVQTCIMEISIVIIDYRIGNVGRIVAADRRLLLIGWSKNVANTNQIRSKAVVIKVPDYAEYFGPYDLATGIWSTPEIACDQDRNRSWIRITGPRKLCRHSSSFSTLDIYTKWLINKILNTLILFPYSVCNIVGKKTIFL